MLCRPYQSPNILIPHFLAMNLFDDAQINSAPLASTKEELLIREIILTHGYDNHYLDSEQLLHLVEGAFHPTTGNDLDISTCDIETGSEEPISLMIYKISNEIVGQCFKDENLHKKTLLLLETLGPYRWDAKAVIALASFMHSFILFRLISQLQSDNPLAVALATFKRLPRAVTKFEPRFKAMNLLIYTMLKVTKFIIRFEGMSVQHELVDADVLGITKSKIYTTTYWIIRSILLCSLEIADLKNLELDEQSSEKHYSVFRYSDKTVIAAWGLHTAGSKLNSLCSDLEEHVDKCKQQIDAKLYDKLLNIFKDNQGDNQRALRTLFASQNEFPLKNSSTGDKCGVLGLKNKVVILLISKPDLMPLDEFALLVPRICDHPQRKNLEGSYAIVWVPISSSWEWSLDEKSSFKFLSNHLPWFSSRRPWLLNSTVVNYIRQEWNFKEEPLMVVLNENGVVSNTNAMDLVWVWGLGAFPFSNARENEIWEQESWIQELMMSADLVEEDDKYLCIYGSEDIVWIREFSATMKKIIKGSGIDLKVVYVGRRNAGEDVKAIIDSIEQDYEACASLTYRMMRFFWMQLERIKKGVRCRQQADNDNSRRGSIVAATEQLVELLEVNGNWAVVMSSVGGDGWDVVKVDDAEKIKECSEVHPCLWGKNVATTGLVGAIRSALDGAGAGTGTGTGTGTCSNHGQAQVMMIPYDEEEGLGRGGLQSAIICGVCKRRVEKFVVYKCED